METLRRFVEAGLDRFNRDNRLSSRYVGEIIAPVLRDILSDLGLEIDKQHRIDTNKERNVFVTHYTNIRAIISILHNASEGKNESLRLYDSAHFNDPEEGNYLFRSLPEEYTWVRNGNPSHAYIASFIAPFSNSGRDVSDNLVFWRTYGREGEGCSLKLSVPRCRLRKVLYGAEATRATESVVLPILAILSPLAGIDDHTRRILAEAIWEPLERVRYLYKSEAYDYENEHRIVVHKSDVKEEDICFDYNGDGDSQVRVRHYCEHEDLYINRMLISGSLLTLGPCVPNSDDLCRSFEILKRRAELDGPAIKTSDISYRKS